MPERRHLVLQHIQSEDSHEGKLKHHKSKREPTNWWASNLYSESAHHQQNTNPEENRRVL